MQVCPATPNDLPAILAIYNEAVLQTTATYDYEPRTLEDRQAWFDDHVRSGHPVLVARSHLGAVLGWAALNLYRDRPGYRFTTENSVYVAAAERGRGVGSLLLGALIEAARAGNFRVVLAAIDAENKVSLRLHERHGFQPVAHFREVGYKFGRWLDVIYMELLLAR